MLAARVLGIACALQEQNAVPGSTNRLVARWARRIYLGFGCGRSVFQGRPLSGNRQPGARGVPDRPRAEVRETCRTSARDKSLVFGGSRGAATSTRRSRAAAHLD